MVGDRFARAIVDAYHACNTWKQEHLLSCSVAWPPSVQVLLHLDVPALTHCFLRFFKVSIWDQWSSVKVDGTVCHPLVPASMLQAPEVSNGGQWQERRHETTERVHTEWNGGDRKGHQKVPHPRIGPSLWSWWFTQKYQSYLWDRHRKRWASSNSIEILATLQHREPLGDDNQEDVFESAVADECNPWWYPSLMMVMVLSSLHWGQIFLLLGSWGWRQ